MAFATVPCVVKTIEDALSVQLVTFKPLRERVDVSAASNHNAQPEICVGSHDLVDKLERGVYGTTGVIGTGGVLL